VVLDLSPEELTAKEASLRAHDALVTVMPDGPEDLLQRPPVERFSFFGEAHDAPVGDFFA
jgi:hypothetical protein